MTKAEIFKSLMELIQNPFGVCALMGNIEIESKFKSNNVQNSYESKIGLTDESYTAKVDSGEYYFFATDCVGYGFCQWTSSGRKANLLSQARQNGKSIGDPKFQIEFIKLELTTGYKAVLKTLQNATSIKEASDYVCKKYERPKNQSESALANRAAAGEAIYKELCEKGCDKMNNLEFVDKLKDVANNYKTLYVMGCFGAPMTAKNKARYTQNHSYNKQAARTKMINAASTDTFGFDCVCLIKGILWGWKGDKKLTYGGAKYAANNVPDIGVDSIINVCSEVSTVFSDIEVGELVWLPGHVGIYIGGGLAVESSPAWKNCVQITACNCDVPGYNRRNWKKHGKLPYIKYVPVEEKNEPEAKPATPVAAMITVKEWQTAAIADGFTFPKFGADGYWGSECESVAKKVVCKVYKKGLLNDYKYRNLTKLVQKVVGVKVNGKFGNDTKNAVIAWQKANSLVPDGCVGRASWKKMLRV